jgi:hypothetical protein
MPSGPVARADAVGAVSYIVASPHSTLTAHENPGSRAGTENLAP